VGILRELVMLEDGKHRRVACAGEVGEDEYGEVKQPYQGEDQEGGLLISVH